MKIKIKEPAKKRLKTTSLLVAVLFLICMVSPYVKLPVIPALMPFIYAIFCCFYLIKYVLPEYTYTINEENLIIEKGKDYSKLELLNIPLSSIKSYKKENIKAKNLTVSPFSKDYMVLTYKEEKTVKKIKIHNIRELGVKFNG